MFYHGTTDLMGGAGYRANKIVLRVKSELTAISCSRPFDGQGHSRGTLIFAMRAMDGTTNGPLGSPLLEFEPVLLPCLYSCFGELYAAPERQRTSGYAMLLAPPGTASVSMAAGSAACGR